MDLTLFTKRKTQYEQEDQEAPQAKQTQARLLGEDYIAAELQSSVDHINFWQAQIKMNALDKIRKALGGRRATLSQAPTGETFINLPEKSVEVLPTDTVDDIKAKLQNPFERQRMSITGAANLAGTIKDRINAAKGKIAQVTANTDGALAKLNSAADEGDKIAKQIEREADDLMAQIGQLSNMAPE